MSRTDGAYTHCTAFTSFTVLILLARNLNPKTLTFNPGRWCARCATSRGLYRHGHALNPDAAFFNSHQVLHTLRHEQDRCTAMVVLWSRVIDRAGGINEAYQLLNGNEQRQVRERGHVLCCEHAVLC